MDTLGKRLIAAAKEARSIARGEASDSRYRIHRPNVPLVPAKAGTQGQGLDSRLRGNERKDS